MKYPLKFPFFVSYFFPQLITKINTKEKNIYLSFDDGPHPEISPWILETLKFYKAKATFFYTGKNSLLHPKIIKRIIAEGHSLGNHTFTHADGWKISHKKYLKEIYLTQEVLQKQGVRSQLFRPPYGRIPPLLIKNISKNHKIIMWTYLSGDFSQNLKPKEVVEKLIKKIHPGDIIVMHESEKAFKNLQQILPPLLEQLSKKGFEFKEIN